MVQYSTSASGTYTTFSDGTSTTTTATVTGLTNNTAYYFKVAAVNYVGTGSYSTVSSGVTPLDPYFNVVRNLTATANNDGSVFLDWDAPTLSNTAPYMYNILFYDLVNGVETSGWGVWTYAANTSYTLGSGMWSGTTGYGPVRFKVQAGTGPCVGEPSGTCLYGPQASADATVLNPALGVRTLTIDSTSYVSSYRKAISVTPPTITSTASAGTGTKTYSSSTTSVCTINSSTGVVAFVSVGTCTIGASIAADSSYNTATASAVSFSVVYAVGDTGPAGGTIFIIPSTTGNSTGKYFEAALGTWNSGYDKNNLWCNLTSTAIGVSAQGTAIGTGQANTTAIAAVCSSGAAKDADTYSVTYSGNTYSDWFLPSQAELYQGYVQRAYLNPQTLTQLHGGSGLTSSYWSSSEAVSPYNPATQAIPVAANGGGDNYGKIYGFNVRPVRMFSPTS